jgi:hypothetical protein
MRFWLVETEPVTQHRWTVERILAPESDNPPSYFARNAVRMGQPRTRLILEAQKASLLKPLEPLLARLLTDPEPIADHHDPLSPIQTCFDKR